MNARAGVVVVQSAHGAIATLDRLEALLKARGILVFARIDFSGDATRAGLELHPEQLLIFGNPKAGTPLMQSDPLAGLDLPLKVLAWDDVEGKSWAAYSSPEYVIERFGLDPALAANLAPITALVEAATRA